MYDIHNNIEEYNINKKHKILIVFDMIADMLTNKKLLHKLILQYQKILD